VEGRHDVAALVVDRNHDVELGSHETRERAAWCRPSTRRGAAVP
jgi:hypothetical protein